MKLQCRFKDMTSLTKITLLSVASLSVTGCTTWVPEPPSPDYKRMSELAHFPDFYPGLGRLYVQPTTLPYGPFQGYNRMGRLVNTIYMIPLSEFDAHATVPTLEGSALPVDHVEIYFNGGHPGVPMPHYHIVLWHISREQEAALR